MLMPNFELEPWWKEETMPLKIGLLLLDARLCFSLAHWRVNLCWQSMCVCI